MVIILPNECNGLDKLQTALSTFDLSQVSNGLSERKVIATIPKFKIETSLTLNTPLTNVSFSFKGFWISNFINKLFSDGNGKNFYTSC